MGPIEYPAIAAGAVLDRAIGKARERDPRTELDDGEAREQAKQQLVQMLNEYARLVQENAELKRLAIPR